MGGPVAIQKRMLQVLLNHRSQTELPRISGRMHESTSPAWGEFFAVQGFGLTDDGLQARGGRLFFSGAM